MSSFTNSHRINSIDFLRGLVMVIMALDHVRDFFHAEAFVDSPTNLATTTPWLFFTRWITHFCAPVFVFLAGTSAFLSGRKKTTRELSLFLIKRGVWLILAEVVIVTLGWTFNPLYNVLILQVIWAIGTSMVILGLLVWRPLWVILWTGLAIVFGHNLLDPLEAARNGQVGFWWDLLHRSHFSPYPIAANHYVELVYAFPVWTGVMLLGYCFGKLYTEGISRLQRKKILLGLGVGAMLLFVLLRWSNAYGDPDPWRGQSSTTFTVLSFLNTTKYPPSLLFLLMTLGPAITFLALYENLKGKLARLFIIYGRVPFFYYVLHLYLIHVVCVVLFFATGYGVADIVSEQTPFLFRPLQFGFKLWVVYLIWIGVVLLLFPLCKMYDQYKSKHRHWWLSYL